MRGRMRALALGLVLCGLAGEASEALAVIGRPLTPVSYAGVARRTARRTTYRAAAYGGGYYGGYYGAPASPAYVTTLPAGCSTVVSGGVSYRSCDGITYQPYYSGTGVVYYPR